MVVCHCHGVSDREIRSEIAGGASDRALLATRCGVGDRCGGCVPTVESILGEELVNLHGALTALETTAA